MRAPSRPPRRTAAPGLLLAVAGTLAALAALSGCAPARASDGRVQVVAAFYPLQYAAEQVGGGLVDVSTLTKPGAEPHDLELSPRDVARVSTARVVVFERGMQPAVDSAVDMEARHTALDVAPAAHLDLTYRPFDPGTPRSVGAGTIDPHFWLDPTRYAQVARAVADRLSAVDPAHRADYQRNLGALEARLATLDHELATGLAHCRSTDIVTSHNAFGYLARRYHLHQVGISGLAPDAEPGPVTLARVTQYARRNHVSTIYSETLASPAVAETVARETGARVAVLDPLEGITRASAGRDYFAVMRANVAALRTGLGCS